MHSNFYLKACRKKRSILDASFDHSVLPTPSKSSPQIDSGLDDEDNFLEADLNHRYDNWIKKLNKIKYSLLNVFRAARQNFFNFLLYWATTTSTSTSTSYTGTGTLSILGADGCTPSGMSACATLACT